MCIYKNLVYLYVYVYIYIYIYIYTHTPKYIYIYIYIASIFGPGLASSAGQAFLACERVADGGVYSITCHNNL